MSDTPFYYLKNIKTNRGRDYTCINDELRKIPVQVRFGPPLTKGGNPDITLLDKGYLGIYVREQDLTPPPRRRCGRAKITLQMVESELEKTVRILRK